MGEKKNDNHKESSHVLDINCSLQQEDHEEQTTHDMFITGMYSNVMHYAEKLLLNNYLKATDHS